MAGIVDLELVDLIRNFLHQRGDQGATVNDLRREVEMKFGTVMMPYSICKRRAKYTPSSRWATRPGI